MNLKFLSLILITAALPSLCSCSGSGSVSANEGAADTIPLEYATTLTLIDHGAYSEARIRNPWDSTALLASYILIPDSIDMPSALPQGTLVRTPLKRSLVYSSVHVGLAGELGAAEAVKGVCDADYMTDPVIKARLASGDIADCGSSMAPDIERIIALSPDAILLSPYENSTANARLVELGIPIIECADYMERSPLARAEWMKFFGLLYGKGETADSLFAVTAREYEGVKRLAAGVSSRPSVLFDGLYANQWHVPGSNSTLAFFIKDAGGTNPFDIYRKSGSIGLSDEKVLSMAQGADFWFARYASAGGMRLDDFIAQHRVYSQFDAAKTGNVYGCNTIAVPFYEEVPFHPQWFLADLASILHPELDIKPTHRYFSKL